MSNTFESLIAQYEQIMHDETLNLGNSLLGYDASDETTTREEYIDNLEYMAHRFNDLANKLRNLDA